MTWLAYSHLGVPKTLQLTTQPAQALAGIPFGVQPVGRVVDGSGVLSRTTGLTVSAYRYAGTGTLSGTTAVVTAEGVFTFTDLRMSTVTSSVQLGFNVFGLLDTISNPFNVTQPNTTIGAETVGYVTTGVDAALSRTRVCQCTPGVYTYTGTNTGLDWSGGATLTDDGYYISTYEPVDANTLLADDFSRGAWYTRNYDDAQTTGGLGQVGVHGWGGNIYDPIVPAGAIVGGGVGLHGREFAATSGILSGIGGTLMADHSLLGETGVSEMYFRIYFKPLPGYVGGHEKMFDMLLGGAGSAQMIGLSYNYFGVGQFRYIPYLYQDGGRGSIGPTDPTWMNANLAANVPFTNGHWHYVEMRMVLNTPGSFDGIFEFWMDDCGVDGTSGPATPTRRGYYNDVKWRGPETGTSSALIRGIWIENWGNPGSSGQHYYANVYCSRAFIGFANPAHQP